MDDKDNKIITFFDKGHDRKRGIVGYTNTFEKEMIYRGFTSSYVDKIKKISDNYTKEKFEGEEIIGFILPQDFANIHTMTSGAVVIFNDKHGVIDIDDYYYTSFKNALENAPYKEAFMDGKWHKVDYFFNYVCENYLTKAKLNKESEDWIYGFRALTFEC